MSSCRSRYRAPDRRIRRPVARLHQGRRGLEGLLHLGIRAGLEKLPPARKDAVHARGADVWIRA